MKKIIKAMAVIAALAMMFGMTACSDSDDDDDDSSSSTSTSISYATLLAKASGEDPFAGNAYVCTMDNYSDTYTFGTDGYVTEKEIDYGDVSGGKYRYVVDANNKKLYMQLYKEYDEDTDKYYTYDELLSESAWEVWKADFLEDCEEYGVTGTNYDADYEIIKNCGDVDSEYYLELLEIYYSYDKYVAYIEEDDKENFEDIDEYTYTISDDVNTLTLTRIYEDGEEGEPYEYTKQ